MPKRDADHLRTKITPPRTDTVPLFETAHGHETSTGLFVEGLGGQPSAEPPVEMPHSIGAFQVRGILGRGAFGIVYRGFDSQLQREVAIKVPKNSNMATEQVDAFLREARAAANIHHQNVCPVYAVGTDAGRPFIVMHLVPNTLAKVLDARKTPFVPRDAAAIVRKLALGVAAAHALDVSHRDLKPANVLVNDANREVLITDFGLAILADETRVSIEGTVKGTPSYMAPEQAHGDIEAIGPLADIHALGVMLYELLTGTLPFRGTTTYVVLDKVRYEVPKPPSTLRPNVDAAIDAICLKAMAKHPMDRYPSARDFVNALTDYLRGSIPALGPTAVVTQPIPKVAPPPPIERKPLPKPAPEIVEVLEPEELIEVETALPLGPTEEELQLLEAVTAGHRGRIKRLIAEGVDIDAPCDQGASVLYYACLTADVDLVQFLLDLGANPNRKAMGEAIGVYAPKPLDLVLQAMFLTDWSRYKPVLELLLKRGASDYGDRVPTSEDLRSLRDRAREQKQSGRPIDKGSWWQIWK